jgi:acylpyruvate hydrolase
MKILAVARTYAAHIEELNNKRPDDVVVFIKPDTAILRNNDPFYYPEYSQDIHHEVEVVLKISKTGKYVEEKFAHKYFDEIGLGIDFTARDLQKKAQEDKLPWTLAKGFNGSAPISGFVPVSQFPDLKNINFSLKVNGELRQQGNTHLMLFSFEYIISYISKFITLKKGDLIFTGTPAGVAPIKIGDRLQAYLEDTEMMNFEVK